MKEILLTQGKVASVDDEDFELLNAFKWYAMKGGNTYYAQRNSSTINGQQTIRMHRMIMNVPDGMDTDHIDRNGLNNQKDNLRVVTNQQNLFNTNAKGFYFNKKMQKFEARIGKNGKHIHLGLFETASKARAAYLKAKKIYHV